MPAWVYQRDATAGLILCEKLIDRYLVVVYEGGRVGFCMSTLEEIRLPARVAPLPNLFLPIADSLDATIDWWLLNALLRLQDDPEANRFAPPDEEDSM